MLLAGLCLAFSMSAFSQSRDFDNARTLYDRGMYVQAEDILQTMPEYGDDPIVDGYAVLCALKLRTDGCFSRADNYMMRYSSSALCSDIRLELAMIHFGDADYSRALEMFRSVKLRSVPEKLRSEYLFKTGYCLYKAGLNDDAVKYFNEVLQLGENDYSAPARYMKGYEYYMAGDCSLALPLFEQAGADERFTRLSNYYVALCQYDAKNYDFLVKDAVRFYNESLVPDDRRPHVARLISEAFLIKGDEKKAREYFGVSDDGASKTRSDYFYAGSLLFQTGEWTDAIKNFTHVTDKPDSISQIAWYQMGQSYVSLKNKVAALDSYKSASALMFDSKIREDAFFNYAKLAFDVNGDTSVFADYIRTYSDKVRGEKIYSYMALAALADKDYQGAIDFYDKIDMLSGVDQNNYVHANYIKGTELLASGSYRKAASCFMAVTFYTPKNDLVNQLARYNMADAYYRDGQYEKAASIYVELYNAAALDGLPQGQRLAYDAAYSLMRRYEYAPASTWFARYAEANPSGSCLKDAMLRKADCLFVLGEYGDAAEAYGDVIYKWNDVNDIYPYYQSALCYGLLKKNNRKLELLEKAAAAPVGVPYYGEAVFELAKAQQAAGKKAAAAQTFERLVQELPGTNFAARATLELGTLRRGEGNVDAALAFYKRVVTMKGGEDYVEDALLGIESIYQSQGQPKQYLAYLESIGRGASLTAEQKEEMVFSAAERQYLSEDYASALASLDDFVTAYPMSDNAVKASYYIAGCYMAQGDKLKACDRYGKVMKDTRLPADLRYKSMEAYAQLSYALENYVASYDAWRELYASNVAYTVKNKAALGMVNSAYAAKDYSAVVQSAGIVADCVGISDADKRAVAMIDARSLLALSRRDEAMSVITGLSARPDTREGAEACYMLAQDAFDKGDFEGVKTRVRAFGQSGTDFAYWLAKSFILLGDSYQEQGNVKQARATWESVKEGYEGKEADIAEMLDQRLNQTVVNQ